MPLILAIEPDRRQAGHIKAIARGRLHAELIVADSAEQALAALGDRVPDLVLTTAFLSPKDESALADRLRALDGKAAYVQTLTIPMLASPAHERRASKAAGMLSALLGDKNADEPLDGCDPAMFAEQCREYLLRAEGERATALDCDSQDESITRSEPEDEPKVETRSESSEQHEWKPEPAGVAIAFQPGQRAEAAAREVPEPAPSAPVVAEPIRVPRSRSIKGLLGTGDDDPPPSLMAAVAALADQESVHAPEPSVLVQVADLAGEDSSINDEPAIEPDDGFKIDLSSVLDEFNSPVVITDSSRATADENGDGDVNVYELDASVLADSLDERPAAADDIGVYSPMTPPEARPWPILEDVTARPEVSEQPAPAETPAAAAAQNIERSDLVDWADIIAALRRDAQPVAQVQSAATPLESAKVDQVQAPVEETTPIAIDAAPAPPIDASPSPPPAADQHNGRRKTTRKQSVEDEWGFFDPDRAGFAALLAKLEEITEDDARKPRKPRRH